MKMEEAIRRVLDGYVGTQINIDSESARDLLAKHISSELETEDFWNNLDQGQVYNTKSDYVDDDLAI